MDKTTKKVLIYTGVGLVCVVVVGATVYFVASAFRSPVVASGGVVPSGGGGGKKSGVVGGVLGFVGDIVDAILPF